MTDFNANLSKVLKYTVTERELNALGRQARRADTEENEAGRNPGPNAAGGVLADLLEDNGDPRSMIVRRSQERRQKAMERGEHPVSLISEQLIRHLGTDYDKGDDWWGQVDKGERADDHHYADGSVLRSTAYTHNGTGKRVHWVYWDVPANGDDSEPHPLFHPFGAPLTDDELEQVKTVK